jgi:predicted MFS family arabinose efflux permease
VGASRKIFYSFTFLTGFAGQAYGIIFNLHMRRQHFTNAQISAIVSSNLWGSAIFGLILAVVLSKFDKRRLLFFSNLSMGALMILRVVILTFPMQLFFAFISGAISSLSGIVLTATLLAKTESTKRYSVFGSQFSISMAANVLGNILGGTMADRLGYSFSLLFAAILQLCSAFLIQKIGNVEGNRHLLRGFSFDTFQKRVFSYYILSNVLVGFGAGLFLNFSNLMFYDLFGLPLGSVGLIMASAQLMTALGSMSSGFLQRKFGTIRVLLTCYTAVVPLMLSLSFTRNLLAFSGLYIVRFMLMNMVNPSFTVLVFSNLPEQMIMSANGFGNLLNNSSRALAAYLYGWIVEGPRDYTKLLLVSTLFYALNALLTWWFKKRLGKLIS